MVFCAIIIETKDLQNNCIYSPRKISTYYFIFNARCFIDIYANKIVSKERFMMFHYALRNLYNSRTNFSWHKIKCTIWVSQKTLRKCIWKHFFDIMALWKFQQSKADRFKIYEMHEMRKKNAFYAFILFILLFIFSERRNSTELQKLPSVFV